MRNPSAVRPSSSQQLLQHLKSQKVLRPGDRVGVAVSGGADSVALLLLLLELREKLGIVLSVVHFNHKLRGKASDSDEKFVAQLAARHKLELHSASADVAAKARKERANLEDAARRARYDYFRSLVDSGSCTRIAVAHTADDQAETVLAHLIRGTGLAGLGGIHPIVGPVFRPLLNIRRAELRTFLRRKKQSWREDVTNRDTKRLRARIRKKLLPLLEKQFQPAIVEHLATLADLAREDEAFLNLFAEMRLIPDLAEAPHSPYAADPNPHLLRISVAELAVSARTHPSIARRMIRRLVERVKKQGGQIGADHVDAVLKLARSGHAGLSIPLPGGVEVRRERDALLFRAASKERVRTTSKPPEFSYYIDLARGSQDLNVPELGCVFRFRLIDWLSARAETKNRETVLDLHQLHPPLILRNWRPGDRLHLFGHRNAQKLKRLFNENRISRWERDGWPVLTSGGTLAWARGFPVAAEFAAREETRTGILIAAERIGKEEEL